MKLRVGDVIEASFKKRYLPWIVREVEDIDKHSQRVVASHPGRGSVRVEWRHMEHTSSLPPSQPRGTGHGMTFYLKTRSQPVNPMSETWQKNQSKIAEAVRVLNEAELHTNIIDMMTKGVASLQVGCHRLAARSGWWADKDGNRIDPNVLEVFATKIALIHSEVSEALEGGRKNKRDDHLPHRPSVEVELADALIRIFDTAGAMGLDLAGAVIEKLAYNQAREDHRPEHRHGDGGKQF